MKRLRLPFVARRSSTATVFSGRTMLMRLFIKRHFAAYTPGMCMSNCWRTHVSARRIANPPQLAKLPHKPSCPTSQAAPQAALRYRGRVKALVKSKAEPGLWLDDVEVPQIGINDVLIQVLRTGICGTDVHIYKWDEWARKTIPVPMAIGHEFVGKIVEVGSNVADFFPGDIVSGEGHVVCGRCRNCFAGRRHMCAHTMGVGVDRPGAFAEFISLPMTNIWRHHEGIDLDVGRAHV